MSYTPGETYRFSGKKVEVVGIDYLDNLPGTFGQQLEMVAYRYVGGSGEVYIRLASAVDFRPVDTVRVGDKIRYIDESDTDKAYVREVTYVSDYLVAYRVTGDGIRVKEYGTERDGFFDSFEVV